MPGLRRTLLGEREPRRPGTARAQRPRALARRAIEPRKGYWDLPGGFLEETEEALHGLRREFLEETGLEIEAVDFLGIDIEPYDGKHVFSVTWLVTRGGRAGSRGRCRGAPLVRARELPDEMAFPSQERLLRDWAIR